MVGHLTKISWGGGSGGMPPRKILNFRLHESHFGVISNSEITLYNHKICYARISRIRSIRLKLQTTSPSA